jgi:hypothetical protein
MRPMNYPLQLSFKIVAIAPQFTVRDASGNLLFYVRQKLFKLKEAITVFGDEAQTRPVFTIKADRVIDFSARYDIADTAGRYVGSVKRQGMRSLWRSHYDVFDGSAVAMTIREENPWVKVVDGVLGELPIVGMFTGYFFNPAYVVTRPDGSVVMRLVKQPAMFEGKFSLEKHAPLSEAEEVRALLSVMMMVLLERSKG